MKKVILQKQKYDIHAFFLLSLLSKQNFELKIQLKFKLIGYIPVIHENTIWKAQKLRWF